MQEVLVLVPGQVVEACRQAGVDWKSEWLNLVTNRLIPFLESEANKFVPFSFARLNKAIADKALLFGLNAVIDMFDWDQYVVGRGLPPMRDLPAGFVEENIATWLEQTYEANQMADAVEVENRVKLRSLIWGSLALVPAVILLLKEARR